ncbi:MAG: hypothetical protein ACRCYS_15375 [Beijerinckiaceae bacterium]
MKLEDQITELLEEALPLRELGDDDPAKERLAGIVDRINTLRAVQAGSMLAEELATPIEGQDAPDPPHVAPDPVKRGPGRPRKAE